MDNRARRTRTLLVLWLLLFGATVTACGSETAKATTPSGANGPASCSADECAKIPEPPIAPNACGDGHENEIGTTCERAATGECRKVLTCGGKHPQ